MIKSKIDIENRKIYGRTGKVYTIAPESLSAARASEFEIRTILLPYRTNFETVFKLINKFVTTLREVEIGKTKVGVIYDLINEAELLQKGLLNFQMTKRPAIVELCGLFCIGEGEDVGTYPEELIREKFDEWREIPDQDFFLLCANVIPYFKESLRLLTEVNRQPE